MVKMLGVLNFLRRRLHAANRPLLLYQSCCSCKAAGLTVMSEPRGLLDDNIEERPADLYITGWRIDGTELLNHAVDVTTPLCDSMWAAATAVQRLERTSTVGSVGRAAEIRKCVNVGSAADQRARGNTRTMSERCRRNDIHFLPVALEGDGHASKNLVTFIKNVSDSAHQLKDANRATFKSYFTSRIANTLHQVSAKLSLRGIAHARQKLLSYSSIQLAGLEQTVELGQELQTTLPAFVCQRHQWRQRNNRGGLPLGTF